MKKLLPLVLLFAVCQVAVSAPEFKIGLGVWIWQLERCEGGDIDKIVAKAQAAHLGHVFVKVTEAVYTRQKGKHKKQLTGFRWASYNDRAKVVDLAKKLKAKGIRVYAWGYHYPNANITKAQVDLIQDVLAMPWFDGFVYNVESEFARQHQGAERVLRPVWEYRNKHFPNKLLVYSTYCRVGRGMGAQMPLEEFSRYTDMAGPQVYWATFFPKESPSPERVRKTVDEEMFHAWIAKEAQWRKEGKADLIRPIMPTGQAYMKTSNTQRIPACEVAQFLYEVRGYFCYNLYLWDKMGPEQWDVLIKGYQAWYPERNKAPAKNAKVAKVQVHKKAPLVAERPIPSITTQPEDRPAKHRHHALWELLAIYGAILWYLVAFIRSCRRNVAHHPEVSLWLVVVVSLFAALFLMFRDAYTVIRGIVCVITMLSRLVLRGTTREV